MLNESKNLPSFNSPPAQHYKSHDDAQKPSFMFLDIVFKAAVTAGKS